MKITQDKKLNFKTSTKSVWHYLITILLLAPATNRAQTETPSLAGDIVQFGETTNAYISLPRRYFSAQLMNDPAFKNVMSNDLQSINWVWATVKNPIPNAKFIGHEILSTNGYTYLCSIFEPIESAGEHDRFASLLSFIRKDISGIPFKTCPVVPSPRGSFSIPESVKSIPITCIGDGAFSECTEIQHIILPENLKIIGGEAFKGCSGLQDLIIGENIIEVDWMAFSGCSALKSISILPRSKPLRFEQDVFSGCGSITKLDLPNEYLVGLEDSFNESFDRSFFNEGPIRIGDWIVGISGTNVTNVCISNGLHLATSFYSDLVRIKCPFSLFVDSGDIDENGNLFIRGSAYSGLTNLCSIIVGPHIKEIAYGAFAECHNLVHLDFRGNIEKIAENAFYNIGGHTVLGLENQNNLSEFLSAFSPSVLATLQEQYHDPCISILIDCASIVSIKTYLGQQAYRSSPEDNRIELKRLRQSWEEHMGHLIELLMPSPVLSPEVIDSLCEATWTLDVVGLSFGFTANPFILNEDFTVTKKSDEEIRLGRHYDTSLYRLMNLFAGSYSHPCAQFWIAERLKNDNDKIVEAVQLYQEAALGFAKGLCTRVSNNEGTAHFADEKSAIAKCVQAIETLGFHTIAESVFLKSQVFQSEKQEIYNNPPFTCYGTAWFINDSTIVTCHHVIENCKEIWTETENGTRIDFVVLAEDPNNDIAILKAKTPFSNHSSLSLSSRLETIAAKVFTVGYPLPDLMGSEKKYNDGTINALSGIGNDNRFYQISIPIQPGNSGGAIVSEEGLVIGLAAAGLDAEKVFKLTGSIPQNVNYAIKSRYITALLQDNGIPYDETSPKSGTDTKAIVDQVSNATILLKAK